MPLDFQVKEILSLHPRGSMAEKSLPLSYRGKAESSDQNAVSRPLHHIPEKTRAGIHYTRILPEWFQHASPN